MALILGDEIKAPLLIYLCSRPYESVKDLIPRVEVGKLSVIEVASLLKNVVALDKSFCMLTTLMAQGLALIERHNAVDAEVKRRKALAAASTMCEADAALSEMPALHPAEVLMTIPEGSSGESLTSVLRHGDLPDNVACFASDASELLTFV